MIIYFVCSLILIYGAEKNQRNLHLPWLIVHPLVTVALVAVMVIANIGPISREFNIYSYLLVTHSSYNVGVVQTFIILWFLIYLWVVVVANWQKLGTQGTTQPLNDRGGKGPPQGNFQETEIPRTDSAWAAPPPAPIVISDSFPD
ncbi:unnamed protein product [Darwinula stevensoni]|uniref:Uncharacterized protein n=1 Tax=Darwinula stevensoni TaxID=69355 RepID=A0A7R9AB07_9CRUS|nr:unnamed protein product [Darwinula stevensoni]CAG0898945.1 unnamed protein product [Darwinula stevensoni]